MTSNSSILRNVNANELLVRFTSFKKGIFSPEEISYCNELMTGKLTEKTVQAVNAIMNQTAGMESNQEKSGQPVNPAPSLKRPLFSYPSTLTSKPSRPTQIRKNVKVKITKKPFQYLSYVKKPAPVIDLHQRVDIKRQKLDKSPKVEQIEKEPAKPQSAAGRIILDSLAPIDLLFGNVEPLPNPYLAKIPEISPSKKPKEYSGVGTSSRGTLPAKSPIKSVSNSPNRSIPATPGKTVLVQPTVPPKSKAAEILKFIVGDDEKEASRPSNDLFNFGKKPDIQVPEKPIQSAPVALPKEESKIAKKIEIPQHTFKLKDSSKKDLEMNPASESVFTC
ncbi:hypothetical protein HK103_002450 [Boothiomyces macroporosus]|uniref:Uncharacterized protein n=1 Tax=Boothiomyces macroporosus TaxID=261099 RepID=A0AAD5U9G1_9FUNG|nr:hypothetical protein HK103_002450 [Boothiomyces macroporosus]